MKSIKRIFIVTAFYAGFINPSFAEWVKVAERDGATIHLKREELIYNKKTVSFWLKVDFPKPFQNKAVTAVSRKSFNCENGTSASIALISYDKDGNVVEQELPEYPKWNAIFPDTMEHEIATVLCSGS